MQNQFRKLVSYIASLNKLSPIALCTMLSTFVAASTACAQVVDVSRQGAPQSQGEKAPGANATGWKFANEQDWIVDSIGRDIAEILSYAKYDQKQKDSPAQPVAFKATPVDHGDGSFDFVLTGSDGKDLPDYKFALTDYLWSTKNYEPYARQLLQNFALKAATASEIPADFISKIASFDMPALLAENERVSRALSANPLDPALHEQAAMLQSIFNMEEYANDFTEDRPQLCRGCVHLSIARALNDGKLGPVGQLADVSLEMMSVRDGVIMPRLEEMIRQAKDPVMASVLRGFKMRADHDCGIFNQKDHTALEESQYFLRNCIPTNSAKMLQYLQDHYKAPPIYLARCLANTCGSVEIGHQILTRIVPLEMSAYMQDYKAFKHVDAADPAALTDDLNFTPKRCLGADTAAGGKPVLRVLSWDDIAAYHGRHILCAVGNEFYFYKNMYGVPELAKHTLEQTQKIFGKLTLAPFLLITFEPGKNEVANYLNAANDVIRTQPELVTAYNFTIPQTYAKKEALAVTCIAPEKWFDPAIPFGTAFFFSARHDFTNAPKDLATLSKIREYCPFFTSIDHDWAVRKFGEHPSYAQYAEAFGRLLNYDLEAQNIASTAAITVPEQYIPLMEKMAKNEPAGYIHLGLYCVYHNRPDQAAKYLEKAVELCSDSVLVSNYCDWLIQYRYDHNQKDKAKQLADFAGEVYSSAGLQAQAKYYERVGDLKVAEKIYRDLMERYDDKTELTAFLYRYGATNKKYAEEAAQYMKPIFPQGIKRVTLADMKGPPQHGTIITEGDALLPESALKKDVVIVALNGFLVENKKQYFVARNLLSGPVLKVIFWDGNAYHEVSKPPANNNSLRVVINDYVAGTPSK